MSDGRPRHRRHRRFIVTLSTAAEGTWLRDISQSGMRILSKHALRIDEPVETGFATELGELYLRGRVVRACRSGADALPYEYGIELDALDAATESRLRRYLETLGSEAAVAPETAVDPLDLQRLHDRIEELEGALDERTGTSSGDASPRAATTDARESADKVDSGNQPGVELASEHGVDPLQTHFELGRFMHLVRLGQPLIPLVKDCARRAEDADSRAVAELFSPCFDLEGILAAIDISFDEEKVLAKLFEFYQRDLIDFA